MGEGEADIRAREKQRFGLTQGAPSINSCGKYAACSAPGVNLEHTVGPHCLDNTAKLGLILYIPRRHAPSRLYTDLLEGGLQALENLKLNLGLSNVLLAAATAGNLLGLGDLVPDGLFSVSLRASDIVSGIRTSALKFSSG